jgi:hypothetical protein
MKILVKFIARIAIILYALAATGIFFSIRGLVQSRRARRVAVFGLEREAAQQTRRHSLNTILLMLLLASAVYITTNIVAPNLEEEVAVVAPTATPIVFVTQEPTATQPLLLYPTITPTPGLGPAEATEAEAPSEEEEINACEIIGSNIQEPTPDQTVSGQVIVQGQANILDFAQYKFEIKGPGTGDQWVVVGTFTSPVPDGFLGTWDSTSLQPGSYVLRLVVSRQDGSYPTPCEVPINIIAGGAGGSETSP